MARNKLNKEINIIEIVKSWRYFERALHHLLPENKRLDFKEKSRYIAINPDPENTSKTMAKDFKSQIKRNLSERR